MFHKKPGLSLKLEYLVELEFFDDFRSTLIWKDQVALQLTFYYKCWSKWSWYFGNIKTCLTICNHEMQSNKLHYLMITILGVSLERVGMFMIIHTKSWVRYFLPFDNSKFHWLAKDVATVDVTTLGCDFLLHGWSLSARAY